MNETWFDRQERERREYIARRVDYLATQTNRIQRAIGVTPGRVTTIDVESVELEAGWVKFKIGNKRGMRRVASARQK